MDSWRTNRRLESKQLLRVNHEYQRGLRWTEFQKCMFIDSIFRGYSVPAFYFHKKEMSTSRAQIVIFDIVDGQQRIDAIYSFSEGAFPLIDPSQETGVRFPNFVKDIACPWGGKRFSELSEELQNRLLTHNVVVYEITTEDENSIRDLFIRLQGGTPLTPQDKRDSWPGNFTEFVLKAGGKSGVDKWYGFPVFKEHAKVSNESRRRQLVAQIFMLFWSVRNESKFCDIKSVDLDEFYHSNVDFDEKSKDCKRFEDICKILNGALHGRPKVVGHYMIHLFLLVDSLMDEYSQGWETQLAAMLFEFDRRRVEAANDIRNRRNTKHEEYYIEYGQLTQTRSDDATTIRRRHAFFSQKMLELLMPRRLDSTRSFSDLERKTVFFRDMEICQWCRMEGNGRRVLWDESDIHHIVPFAEGGRTSIDNAALVHRGCHPKSRADVEEFRDWWLGPNGPLGQTNDQRKGGGRGPRQSLPPEGTSMKFEYQGLQYSGIILEGEIALQGSREGIRCKSFSQASGEITNNTRNGWRDWYIRLPGEETWLLASDWREREEDA